jgi:hypothetical protein
MFSPLQVGYRQALFFIEQYNFGQITDHTVNL